MKKRTNCFKALGIQTLVLFLIGYLMIFIFLCYSSKNTLVASNSLYVDYANSDESWDTNDIHLGIVTSSLDKDIPYSYDAQNGHAYFGEKNNGMMSFIVELSQVVNYDVKFRITQKRVQSETFTEYEDFVSEFGYEKYSSEWYNEFNSKLESFNKQEEAKLKAEGDLFTIPSEIKTVPAGSKNLEVFFTQSSNIEDGNKTRLSEIALDIITDGVGQNYNLGYRGVVTYHIYDLDGENELLILSPSDTYENDGYVEIPVIRTGNNAVVTNVHAPSFNYHLSNNINVGGEVEIKSKERFENYNSNFTFNSNQDIYDSKAILRLNIIDNNEVGYLEQYNIFFNNFINCGESIYTTILGQKYLSTESAIITFSLLDDEYENLDLSQYSIINLLNQDESSDVSIIESEEYNISLSEGNSVSNIILKIERNEVTINKEITLNYTLSMDKGLYGERFTISKDFDEFTHQGSVTFLPDSNEAYIPITTFDDNIINDDVKFKLHFSIIGDDSILFSRGKKTIGVKIANEDYLPNNSVVEFGYFTNRYWDGSFLDYRRPDQNEEYTNDGNANVVISSYTYLNTTFNLGLNLCDYTSDVPLTFAIKIEDVTAKSGVDYAVDNQIIFLTTDFSYSEKDKIEFTIKNQLFEGIRRFKLIIMEEYLPEGVILGENAEFIVDIIGLMPKGFWSVEEKNIEVNKGDTFTLSLTRYSREEKITNIDICDLYNETTDVEDIFPGIFPIAVNWAENETNKTISIPVNNNKIADENARYLQLVLLDDFGNKINNNNLSSYNNSCNLVINNTYDGGVFYIGKDENKAYMYPDGQLKFIIRRISGTDVATVYYKVSMCDDNNASMHAIDKIDFMAGIYSYTFADSESQASVSIALPDGLIRNGNNKKVFIELVGTSDNAVLCTNHYQFSNSIDYLISDYFTFDYYTMFYINNVALQSLLPKPFISSYTNGVLTPGIEEDNYEKEIGVITPTIDTVSMKELSNMILNFDDNSSITLNIKNINSRCTFYSKTSLYLFSTNDLLACGVTISYNGEVIPQRVVTNDVLSLFAAEERETSQIGPLSNLVYYYQLDLIITNDNINQLTLSLEEGYNEIVNFDIYPLFTGELIAADTNSYYRNIQSSSYEVTPEEVDVIDFSIELYNKNDVTQTEISEMVEPELDFQENMNHYYLKIGREDTTLAQIFYFEIIKAQLGVDIIIKRLNGSVCNNGDQVTFGAGESEVILELIVPKNKNYNSVTCQVGLFTDSSCKNIICLKDYNIRNTENVGTFSLVPTDNRFELVNGRYTSNDVQYYTVCIKRNTKDLLPINILVDIETIGDKFFYPEQYYGKGQIFIYGIGDYYNDVSELGWRKYNPNLVCFEDGQTECYFDVQYVFTNDLYSSWDLCIYNPEIRYGFNQPQFEEVVTSFSSINNIGFEALPYQEEDGGEVKVPYRDGTRLSNEYSRIYGSINGYLNDGVDVVSGMSNKTNFILGEFDLNEGYYLEYQNNEFYLKKPDNTKELFPLSNYSNFAIHDFSNDGVKDIMIFATYGDDYLDDGEGVFLYNVKNNTFTKLFNINEWYGNYSFGLRDLDGDCDFEFFYVYSPNSLNDYTNSIIPNTRFEIMEILPQGILNSIYKHTTNENGKPVYNYSVVPASQDKTPYIKLWHFENIETDSWDIYLRRITNSYTNVSLKNAEDGIWVDTYSNNNHNFEIDENGCITIKINKPGNASTTVTVTVEDTNLMEGVNTISLCPRIITFAPDEHFKEIKYQLFDDGVDKEDLYVKFKITTDGNVFWNSLNEITMNVLNTTYQTKALRYSIQDVINNNTISPSSITGDKLLIDSSFLDFSSTGLDKFTYQIECTANYVLDLVRLVKVWQSNIGDKTLSINNIKNAIDKDSTDVLFNIAIKLYYNGELYHTYHHDSINYYTSSNEKLDISIANSGSVGYYWGIDIAAKESQLFNIGCEIIDSNGNTNLFKCDENGNLSFQYLLPSMQGNYDYQVKIYNYTLDTVEIKDILLPVYGTSQIGLLSLLEYDSRPISVSYQIDGLDVDFRVRGETDENGIAIVENLIAGKHYSIYFYSKTLEAFSRDIFLTNDQYMETVNMKISENLNVEYYMSKINKTQFTTLYNEAAIQLNKVSYKNGKVIYLSKELDLAWAIMNGALKANTMITELTGKSPNNLTGELKEAYNKAIDIVNTVRSNLLYNRDYVFFDFGGENIYVSKNLPTAPEYVELEDDEILYCVLYQKNRSAHIAETTTIKTLYGNFKYTLHWGKDYNSSKDYAFINQQDYNYLGWVVCKEDDYYEIEFKDDFLFEETNGIKTIPLLSVGAGLATSLVQDVDSVMADIDDIDIPDGIKFFGGATMGLGIGDSGDLEFQYDRIEMTLSIQLGAAKDANLAGKDPDELLKEFKEVLKNNKSGALKMGGGYVNMEVGVGAVIEYKFNTETKNWELDWGRFYFASSYTFGYTVYAVIPVVYIPVYINGEVTLSTEFGLVLDWDQTRQEIDIDGDASIGVKLHVEAGIGVPGLLSVAIYGETEIKITIQFSTGGTKTELYVDGGVKLTVLFWRKTVSVGRYDKEWTSSDWKKYSAKVLYESRLGEFTQLSNYSGAAILYDLGEVKAIYALDEEGMIVERVFVDNIYESAIPQIAEAGDGTKMMAWINYDATRGINNAEVLNYIYFDGENWSDIKVVDETPTADVDFSLDVINDTYVISYLDVKTLLEEDTISDRLLNTDAALSMYNKDNDTWDKTIILENDLNDNRIVMATDKDKAVLLVYETKNTNITDNMTVGDYLGGDETNNVLLVKTYNESWSQFTLLLDQDNPPIINMSCILVDDISYILLNLDIDSNFKTVNDREIVLIKYNIITKNYEKVILTDDDIKDSAPVVVELDKKPVYIYNSGNELKYIIDDVSYTLDTDFNADLENITAYSSEKYIALVWECTDETGKQQIAMSLLDKINKRFSEPFIVTSTEQVSRDAIVVFNEDIITLYFCDDTYTSILSVTPDNNGEYAIVDFNVSSQIKIQQYNLIDDIKIAGLEYDVDNIMPKEENEVILKITNMGILAVNNAMIRLYNGETLLGEYKVEGIIRGGGYLEYICDLLVPEESFTLTAKLYKGEEMVNSEDFNIILRDLSILNFATSERENDYQVIVLVQNNSNLLEENVNILITDYRDHTIIYGQATIDVLTKGNNQTALLNISKTHVVFNSLGLAWFKIIILAENEEYETLANTDYNKTNNIFEMFISESDIGNGIIVVPNEITLDINESKSFDVIYTGNESLTYISSDVDIATISNKTVTGIKVGNTTITISDGTFTSYVTVIVTNTPKIILNGGEETLLVIGNRYKELGAIVTINDEKVIDAKINMHGTVNNLVCNKYIITYTYMLGGVVAATAKRIVNVIPESPLYTYSDHKITGYGINNSEVYLYKDDIEVAKTTVKNQTFLFDIVEDGTYYLRTSINGIFSNLSNTCTVGSESYTIIWKNDNGDILETNIVQGGVVPVYQGEIPTKASTSEYIYTFIGWSPIIVEAVGDVTYTAMYLSSENTQAILEARFKTEVSVLTSAKTRTEKFSLIKKALATYNELDNKANVLQEFSTLKNMIVNYNNDVGIINNEYIKSNDVAFKLISSSLTIANILACIWIIFKKTNWEVK